jgi:hypothetical protein
LSITERDIQNSYNHCLKSSLQFLYAKFSDILIESLTCRRTALIQDEAIDDIQKLQAFFDECKNNNM